MLPKIRAIEPEDIPAIARIEEQDPYTPWSEALIQDCLNRENYYHWLLADGQTVVGYIIYSIVADECHVMNIAVHPQHRGKGYSQQLLQQAIADAAKHAAYMILEVREENSVARHLYEKFGFKPIGLRRNYYQQGTGNRDALVYRLDFRSDN